MKYYLIQHQYLNNGKVAITPVAEFDSLDKAKADWHSKQAYNMIAENVIATLTLIYEPNGRIVLNDYWQREIKPVVTENNEEEINPVATE